MPLAEATSLSDFVNQVKQLRKSWSLATDKELWFRGEAHDYGLTKLHPVLYRPAKEFDLKPTTDLLMLEETLFDTFERLSLPLVDNPTEDPLDAYLIMQHHGAPTRLLDWSDGSLMALHFALKYSQTSLSSESGSPVVYVLEPDRLSQKISNSVSDQTLKSAWTKYIKKHSKENFDQDNELPVYLPRRLPNMPDLPSHPILLEFPHITRRVAAQRSRFIVFGSDPSWLANELNGPNPSIKRILIQRDQTAEIRKELRECGITESVIFPDLDGLGRELQQLWNELLTQ